jgi:hypothetical protein
MVDGQWTASGDDSLPTVVAGHVDSRGAVVELERAGYREIYAQSFAGTDSERGNQQRRGADFASPTLSDVSSIPWLDLDGGRFRGHAAHLQLDAEGQLLACCLVGGLEFEWAGEPVWSAAHGPEDTHVVPEKLTGDSRSTLEADEGITTPSAPL